MLCPNGSFVYFGLGVCSRHEEIYSDPLLELSQSSFKPIALRKAKIVYNFLSAVVLMRGHNIIFLLRNINNDP